MDIALGIDIGDHIIPGAAERGGHRRLWNPLPGRASGSSGGRWSASSAPSVRGPDCDVLSLGMARGK